MKVREILRKNPAFRSGYQLNSISITSFDPKTDCGMPPMKLVPHKITAYLDRAKIKEAYRCTSGIKDFVYYIVRATDGTLFHLEY